MSASRKAELEFAEHCARLYEDAGASRISGRIVGWLLICDPPEQSQPELVEVLAVSKASISTELRTLIGLGIVERTTKPGDRRSYYRIKDDAWPKLIARRMRMIAQFRDAAGKGLELLGDAPSTRRARLDLLHRVYGHMERAMRAALDEIEAEISEFDSTRRKA